MSATSRETPQPEQQDSLRHVDAERLDANLTASYVQRSHCKLLLPTSLHFFIGSFLEAGVFLYSFVFKHKC